MRSRRISSGLLARWPEPGIPACLESEHHLGYAVLLPATACMEADGASPEYLAAFTHGFAREWLEGCDGN